MIRNVVDEFERRSVHLTPEEEGEIRGLLHKYEPVLRFHAGERFFPVSAILYLLFGTIWYIPLKSREGEEFGDNPYKKRRKPGLFEILFNHPHIQLNTEVDQDNFGEGEAEGSYVQMRHLQRSLMEAESPADYPVGLARRMLESRMRRFRSAWLNPGMLFVHFSDAISPWDRRLLRHWFLPRGCDDKAKQKYDELTFADGRRATSYYGRVVDQCGYRVLQYWFFYAFNDFRTGARGTNNHEGDWERICIYLVRENGEWRPRHAAYSAHHTKQIRAWEEVECADATGEHPVAYVARGSHACYFERDTYKLGMGLRLRDYALGDGEEIGPETWGTPRILTETGPDWLFFDGFWGAYIRDILMRENAPRGPLYTIEPGFHRPVPRPTWYNPVGWADLPCLGDPTCDHELHGFYSYPSTEAAWQEDWGSDEEWNEWAKGIDSVSV